MKSVQANYRRVREATDLACLACQRDPQEVLLLAVSKTMPEEDIQALYDMGIRDFGENRIQELERKAAALPGDIRWHFIGPMQSNKIRKAAKIASLIHSIESISAVEKLEKVCEEEKRQVDFLLEVNVSGEKSKGGVPPEGFMELARNAARCQHARFAGLMTMAPFDAPQETLDLVFSGLAKLKEQAEEELEITLPILSMGMSGDYTAAIACGSTLIRVGTAIFGKLPTA